MQGIKLNTTGSTASIVKTLKDKKTEYDIRNRTKEKLEKDAERILQLEKKVENLQKEIDSLKAKQDRRNSYLNQQKSAKK